MISIIIPTYNRSKRVIKRLHELECLTNPLHHEIIIIDNKSDEKSWLELSSYCDNKLSLNVVIRRNSYNIGMAANLARGLEYANGDWIVVLGDDDPINPSFWNHIETALQFKQIDTVGCFLFTSQIEGEAFFPTSSSLLDNLDSFPLFATLGAFMIHREKIENSIRDVYTLGMISFHPQVCCLLSQAISRNAYKIVPGNLVSFRGDSEDGSPSWSKPKLFMGNFALLFQNSNLSEKAFIKYANLIKINGCGPFTLISYLLDKNFSYSFAQVRYIHRLIYHSCIAQINFFSYLNFVWLLSLMIIVLPDALALRIFEFLRQDSNQYSKSEQRM